jgi:predicted RNA-binding protein with PIN domain
LIDGYNLLHASGVFGERGRTSLEGSREALLDWLAEFLTPGQRRRTTIVFDARCAPPGLPRYGEKHGLQIRFAPRGREADDVLEELIAEHSAPRSVVVVSSDHRVQRAARRRRASAVDSDQWVRQLKHAERGPARASDQADDLGAERLTGDELQAWLDEFSADGPQSGRA